MTTRHPHESLGQLEDTLHDYLVKRSPVQLPPNVKEAIVQYGPWITLILLIISLPTVLALFGIGAVLMPFSYLAGPQAGMAYTLSLIILAVVLILEALAIPKLLRRERGGWNLMYYATLINFVSMLVNRDIVGALVGALIGLYILFQIREYYH